MRPRAILVAVVLGALPLLVLTSAPAHASVPIVVIEGRGFGHGVGLSQDGAYWMAKGGARTDQILGRFYPGTTLTHRAGFIRVPLLSAPTDSATLTLPQGGLVQDGPSSALTPSFPLTVSPGGQVRIWFDGAYHVESTVTPTVTVAASTPLVTVPASGGTVTVDARGRPYRGIVRAEMAGGQLQLVDQVDVEQYLRGMGEVRDPRWPPAALRAQAVVARTYALRAMADGGQLCDTTQCQVYLGASAEYPAMNKAVADTQGQVLTWRGQLAATVYSASGGGISATPTEGFGTSSSAYPYLVVATYPTLDPKPWRVAVALPDLGDHVGYRGEVSGVRVTRAGPSGRALEVTVDGSVGPMAVGGIQFQQALGLRSTLFSLRSDTATVAPPTLPPASPTPVVPLAVSPPTTAPPMASPRVVPRRAAAVAAPSVLGRGEGRGLTLPGVFAIALGPRRPGRPRKPLAARPPRPWLKNERVPQTG